MSANILEIPASGIRTWLENNTIHTQAEIRFDRDSMEVRFASTDALRTFTFELVGSAIRLVEREMTLDGVEPKVSYRTICDFSKEPQP